MVDKPGHSPGCRRHRRGSVRAEERGRARVCLAGRPIDAATHDRPRPPGARELPSRRHVARSPSDLKEFSTLRLLTSVARLTNEGGGRPNAESDIETVRRAVLRGGPDGTFRAFDLGRSVRRRLHDGPALVRRALACASSSRCSCRRLDPFGSSGLHWALSSLQCPNRQGKNRICGDGHVRRVGVRGGRTERRRR
jgi:hypothetical protein